MKALSAMQGIAIPMSVHSSTQSELELDNNMTSESRTLDRILLKTVSLY